MKSFFIAAFLILSAVPVLAQSSASDSVVVSDASNVALNQDNPSVIISRKDKHLIVVGASSDYDDMDNNGMLAYTTTDMGKTWASSRLPLTVNQNFYTYGEPAVVCDNSGTFYYAYITNDGADSAGNISFATSPDGKNWKNETPINNNTTLAGFPDGVSICVDNSPLSPRVGRVYAVWNQYFSDPLLFTQQGVTISWSDNGCKTWSTPKLLGSSDDYQEVRTGKNGEIYVSVSDSNGFGQLLFTSIDGGNTFDSQGELIGLFRSYPYFPIDATTGYTRLKGSVGFAAFPYISFDVDLTTNRIHCVFGDFQDSLAIQYYVYSDDNGKNWSDQEIVGLSVGDPISADRFDPSVSVDQKTHEAYILYYSSESDVKNIMTAPFRIRVRDTTKQMLSATFDPLVVERSATTDPYIGDHTASDAYDSIYVAGWTQNKTGLSDGDVFVYVSSPKSAKNGVEVPVLLHSNSAWLSAPYPNPSSGKNISFSYYLPHASNINLDLFDATGKLVRHLLSASKEEGSYVEQFSLANITEGSYMIRMVTDTGQLSRKLVIMK